MSTLTRPAHPAVGPLKLPDAFQVPGSFIDQLRFRSGNETKVIVFLLSLKGPSVLGPQEADVEEIAQVTGLPPAVTQTTCEALVAARVLAGRVGMPGDVVLYWIAGPEDAP